MTRWGILADIHGNLPALRRALAQFEERHVEKIAVLGDNLGRGDSDACIRLIQTIADVSVLGNRDLDWQDRVSAASRDYVLSLPRTTVVDGIAFAHGDARLTRDLSSSDSRAEFRRARGWLTANTCRVWLFGHTHRARVWTLGPPDAPPILHVDAATHPLPAVVRLVASGAGDGDLLIVNAGSVGLPFPGKGPASATIYDAETGTVVFFPV